MSSTTAIELLALAQELHALADKIAVKAADMEEGEPIAMLGGVNGVSLVRHIKGMSDEFQRQYHTPLYERPPAPHSAIQSNATTLEELTALAITRGYKDPIAWARHVLAGRKERIKSHDAGT